MLGDRAGSLGEIKAIGNAHKAGADDTLDIDAVMFVETLVLDRHKCMRKIIRICRDLLVSLVHTVGVGILQRIDHSPVLVHNGGRKSFGLDIVR